MIIKDDLVEEIATPTGPMRTCLFRPGAEGRYPGIVLFSEIFQITGPIRRTAAFLAGHGYLVAVPEVYHELEPAGAVWPTTRRARIKAMRTSTRKNFRLTIPMRARCSTT